MPQAIVLPWCDAAFQSVSGMIVVMVFEHSW